LNRIGADEGRGASSEDDDAKTLKVGQGDRNIEHNRGERENENQQNDPGDRKEAQRELLKINRKSNMTTPSSRNVVSEKGWEKGQKSNSKDVAEKSCREETRLRVK